MTGGAMQNTTLIRGLESAYAAAMSQEGLGISIPKPTELSLRTLATTPAQRDASAEQEGQRGEQNQTMQLAGKKRKSASPLQHKAVSLSPSDASWTPDMEETAGVAATKREESSKRAAQCLSEPADDKNEHTRPRRTSRRRRPRTNSLDSGITKGHHERVYVKHSYHDHANEEPDDTSQCPDTKEKKCGGTSTPFPVVLHEILEAAEEDGYADIISWQPHGRCFLVHSPERFVVEVMPRFFRQTRFSSFQRQLSLYGFLRLTRKGPDYSAYYHELFLRGKPFLCRRIHRIRIKGYWVRQSSSPETEPDFSNMPAVGEVAEKTPRFSDPATLAPARDPSYDYFAPVAMPAPWAIPLDPSFVAAPVPPVSSKIPPMPPLSASHSLPAVWPVVADQDVLKMDKAAKPTVGADGVQERDELAAFLLDVDLESTDDRDLQAFRGESNLAEIFATERAASIKNATGQKKSNC